MELPFLLRGAAVEELNQFLSYFKIVVYDYNSKGRALFFNGPDALYKLNLLHHNWHFYVISSLTSAVDIIVSSVMFYMTMRIGIDVRDDAVVVEKRHHALSYVKRSYVMTEIDISKAKQDMTTTRL